MLVEYFIDICIKILYGCDVIIGYYIWLNKICLICLFCFFIENCIGDLNNGYLLVKYECDIINNR